MFTGLIEGVGRVERFDGPARGGTADADGARLRVATPLAVEMVPGESVAVDGVCLTVAASGPGGFEAVVSPQTLRVTALGGLRAGRAVNLERALRADARLGGHFVLGHVDGVGTVAALSEAGENRWLDVDLPDALLPAVVDRGSIAVDGISLTVAALAGRRVGMQIVPHTLAHTALGERRAGDAVNIETDIIGKYVARLLGQAPASAVPEDA